MKTYSLKNDILELSVLELGATASSLKFNGSETMLGYSTPEEYEEGTAYFSAVVGRYGNRIGGASFVLDGKRYELTANERKNQLHGGPMAFSKRKWTAENVDENEIRLSIFSPDGDNGFPGNLKMTVTYTLSGNALRLVFEAETDAPTVFAPTFHPYFRYSGTPSIMINAGEHVEVDEELIPTGRLLPCEGRYDFSSLRPIDSVYDDAFVLRGTHALTYKTPEYTMELHTDFPAAQVYSGRPGGVAIEPEAFPDSPNHANFPSTALYPGEKFRKWAEYRFF